jgi:hypothetical protein
MCIKNKLEFIYVKEITLTYWLFTTKNLMTMYKIKLY